MLTSKEDKCIGNDIYRVAVPYRVDTHNWVADIDNAGYAVIGTNYSDDYRMCGVIYYTKSSYGKLGRLVAELDNGSGKYGYLQARHGRKFLDDIGGFSLDI